MASELWNITTKKITASVGAGLVGYSVLQPTLTFLPVLSEKLTSPFMGSISVLTLAGVASVYALWLIWKEF